MAVVDGRRAVAWDAGVPSSKMTGGAAAEARRVGRCGVVGAFAFAAAALLGVAFAWGFSVDDALIPARVAHHLATGAGYRFNASGPRVDCVTPLGWAPLLAAFARGSPWQAVTIASVGGAGVWALAAARLGWRCGAVCGGWRLAGVAGVLGSCLPLGAWAVSGMETAFVMALGVLALTPNCWGAACAGLAAAWRPELAPWALALSFGQAVARRAPAGHKATALVLALGPPVVVALWRQALFGHPAPLAVFAKPSDFEHGVRYALGSMLLSGPPYLLVAGSWRSLAREHRATALAVAVHVLVLVGVGGDWMPFWRLAMPTIPGVLLVGSALLGSSASRLWPAPLAPALAAAALLHAAHGSATRQVRTQRARLIAELPRWLDGARRVASVDVGWVGAAGDHELVDLAGVTDPEVAYLAGGHTSKRLPADFLERRQVDALVLLTREDGTPTRQVERRVLTLRGVEEFENVGRLSLDQRQAYIVLRRTERPREPEHDGEGERRDGP